jgi:hypothetical protein
VIGELNGTTITKPTPYDIPDYFDNEGISGQASKQQMLKFALEYIPNHW